jgi:competence protein ComEC
MSFLNPYVLWDIGFQLSYAAVMGMALLTPPGERWLRARLQSTLGKDTGKTLANWLSEPLIVTIAAQVSTLPIILHYFGQVSPISPFANFLVIPVQPLILVFGALGTLASFVWPAIGALFYQVAWLFLTYTVEIVRALADIAPTIDLGIPAVVMWAGLFVIVAYVVLNATRPVWWENMWKEQQMWRPVVQYTPLVLALFLLGGMGQRLTNQPDDKLHVVFLDMGHSNSVLILTPDGAAMLIDGGRFPSRLLTALGDYLPPNKDTIDVLLVTGDETIDALPDVIDRYDVQALVYNPIQGEVQPAYNTILNGVENKIPAQVGWRVRTADGVEIEIVAPQDDASSMVLRLTYGEAVFLFTSDMRSTQEEILLENPHLAQATVLQAGNHGALRTNSDTWVDTVNPQVVVVQTDPAARENATADSVIAQFEDRRLLRTDEDGTIEIVTDGKALEIISPE